MIHGGLVCSPKEAYPIPLKTFGKDNMNLHLVELNRAMALWQSCKE